MEIIRFVIDFLSFYTIYLMLSISLNLEYGYAGISNFGKVLFFAGGAFTVGSMATRLTILLFQGRWIDIEEYINTDVIWGTKVSLFFAQHPLYGIFIFLFLLVLAMSISALLGYIASYPAIRLREDYLGMTLVVSGELLRNIAKNYQPLVCGTFGVYVPNPFSWATGIFRDLLILFILLIFSSGIWLIMEYLLNSPFGRLGAAVGALFYVFIDRLIAYYKHWIYLPFDINYMSYIILSIILILVIFYSPQGLFPEKPARTPVIEKLRRGKKIKSIKMQEQE